MASVALGRREAIVARATKDRPLLRAFLEQDRLYAAYAICDLEEREFTRTRWGLAWEGDSPVALVLEYSGPTPQPLFVMGRVDGIRVILRDVIRPRIAFVAAPAAVLPAIETAYRVDPGPSMIRMWVDRARFRPYPATVQRLLPVEIGDLNRLYQLGFASWLPASTIAEGVYYGMRVNGHLVAAAGTHVISRNARMAVVGNVLTHTDFRGRGFATAVTVLLPPSSCVHATRSRSTSARTTRRPSTPTAGLASPNTSASRSGSSTGLAHPGRASPPRCGGCSIAGRPIPDDHRQRESSERRHGSRPGRRRCPSGLTGRTARCPSWPPFASGSQRSDRSPAGGSAPACT